MANVPKIRFPGFTEPWEQRKFDEAFIERRDKTEKENEDILLSCAINGMFLNSELFGHFRGTTTIGYLRVKKNDLILSAQNLHLGNANVNLRFEHGIISPAYKVYDLNNCNPEFVQSWVKRDDTKKFFLAATTEGASQCRKNIEWETLGKQTILMPSLDEQKRVGSFFGQLDHLITLHQRKVDDLKTMKKCLLQEMFPAEGSNVPKIRFPGFTDPWEQRKLSEMVGMTYGGGTPSTANDTFWYGDIPWIQSSNVVEDELFNVDIKKHISRDGLNHSAAQLVPENSVAVVTHVGVGKLVFMPYSYTTSQDFISLGDMKCEPRFLCYALYKRLQEDLHIVQGSAIKGITKEDLMNKLISVPQITEQTKIANTLQGLDHLITLHQSELEKLQKIKKSLLERMFV